MKVFTEASGSLVAGALINQLKKAKLHVVASDIDDINAGALLSDSYVKVPFKKDKNLWVTIMQILIKHNIDWVIPSFDEMLEDWSSREVKINFSGVKLMISPPRTISTFVDKWETFKAFRNMDISTPKTSKENIYAIVKPRRGRGSKGIFFNNKNISMEGNISQEVALGNEITIDCLFDLDGAPIYIVPRLRSKIINGKSVNGIIIENQKIVKEVKRIASNYHFIGPINIQVFLENQKFKFIEINPRVGGGMALSWAATENWFDLWFNKIINNKRVNPKKNQIWTEYV